MKKRKWNRVLSIFLVMVTVISLMSGCDRKSAKNERERYDHCIFMEHKSI